MSRLPFQIAFVTLIIALSLGCAAAPVKPIQHVEGRVAFTDGTPLPKGTRVVFSPSEGVSKTASGVTNEDGSFKLTHASGRTGAEEGKYVVQLLAPEGDSGEFFKLVPSSYNDGSRLSAEVKPGMGPVEISVQKMGTKKR
jgi:hypothetical protein